MENPNRLIIRAFEQARDAGKIDWSRMTTAVLKNRILVLTDGHGREILHVAMRELAQGFHWDVSHSAPGATLGNSSETWSVNKGGYVNVYPDGHIRGGRGAKKVYPREKENPPKIGGLCFRALETIDGSIRG